MSAPPSLRRNLFANYVSQAYSGLIGIVMIPLYLKYLGMEAFGLIGFFAGLQAWVQLLDFGFSATLGREASKFNAGATTLESVNVLLRFLEMLFGVIGGVVTFMFWMAGPWIADTWLKLGGLTASDVALCVGLVGVTFSLRLASGLYRSALLGLERQVSANVIAIVVATLRSVAVLPVLIWVSNSVLAFFLVQLATAVVEILLVRLTLRRQLPRTPGARLRWGPIDAPMRFGAALALVTFVWIAVTQVDKLILSHLLSMRDYGKFALAATLGLGVMSLAMPLNQAVLPRLTFHGVRRDHAEFIALYRRTTQLLAGLLAGVGGVMVAFPFQVVFAWTGDAGVAAEAAGILMWYAAGSSFVGIAGMTYLLQHALGDLRLHIKGNLLTLFTLVPVLILSSLHYGAIGAAKAWAATNLLFLLIWTPIVHNKFAPQLRAAWLIRDVGPGLAVAYAIVVSSYYFPWPIASRVGSALGLLSLALAISAATLVARPETRRWVLDIARSVGTHS